MFDLFSDIFTYRDNPLTRSDPRVKLLIAVCALIAVVTSGTPALPLGAFGVCIAAIAALRIPIRLVALRLAAPFSTVAVLVAIHTFVTGTTPIFTIALGGWTLTAKYEGLRQGMLLGARVLGSLSIVFLLGIVTPAHRIFQALRGLRISKEWVEIAILMYRYIFVLMDRAGDLADAQRLRLGYTAPRRAMASFASLVGATVVHSFEQARRTNDAMLLRGYRGTMPFGPLPAISPGDLRLLAAWLALIITLYVILEWGIKG